VVFCGGFFSFGCGKVQFALVGLLLCVNEIVFERGWSLVGEVDVGRRCDVIGGYAINLGTSEDCHDFLSCD